MKILVLGTGVIGTTYGYVLGQAGHDVRHYVRLCGESDRRPGDIPLRLLDGRTTTPREIETIYRARIVDTFAPTDGYDFILVSPKHYDLAACLPRLAMGAGSADIVMFNNWWDTFAAVDHQLAGRYLWGFPVAGGGWQDGALDAAILDHVELAEPDDRESPRLTRIAACFESAGLTVERPAHMRDWLWIHFATEAGLIASAIEAGGVDALLDDTARLTAAVLAVRDALEVCRARGADVDGVPDAQAFYAPAEMVAAGIRHFYAMSVPARRILDRHTGVEELKRIYRDVVSTGRELGVTMPRLIALEPIVEAWDGSVAPASRSLVGAGGAA